MKKFFKVLLPVLLVALLLGGGIWYLRNYQGDFFSNFLQRRGDAAMAGEHYTTALRYYRWAWELDDTDPELAVSLASAYAHTDNYTKAEYTLVNAIAAMPEELQLYLALSETYVAQDKLLDASQLLDRVENESIRTQLAEARPDAPVLTPESGYYSEYISVGLEASSGTAYLSVDGSFPSLEDDAYAAPIQLTAGETSAIALCIGDNGLVSSAVYASYTIGGVVEPVTLQDSALDTYIRQLLELGQDDAIMSNALWAISELTVPQDVTSLADLRYFTGLKTLTIQNFQGGDFSFLENLSQLEHVDFTGSLVTSDTLSLLGQQKNLKWLNLSTCGVSDLSSLSGCTQLEYLNLANDHVADRQPAGAVPAGQRHHGAGHPRHDGPAPAAGPLLQRRDESRRTGRLQTTDGAESLPLLPDRYFRRRQYPQPDKAGRLLQRAGDDRRAGKLRQPHRARPFGQQADLRRRAQRH